MEGIGPAPAPLPYSGSLLAEGWTKKGQEEPVTRRPRAISRRLSPPAASSLGRNALSGSQGNLRATFISSALSHVELGTAPLLLRVARHPSRRQPGRERAWMNLSWSIFPHGAGLGTGSSAGAFVPAGAVGSLGRSQEHQSPSMIPSPGNFISWGGCNPSAP